MRLVHFLYRRELNKKGLHLEIDLKATLSKAVFDRVSFEKGRMMQAGQNTDMRRGAVAACVIPMGLGLLSLISLLISPNFSGPFHYSVFPISFLFVAPLTAWLACRRLKRLSDLKQLSRWRTSFFAGLGSASLVQFTIAAILTTILLIVVMIGGLRDGASWYYIIGNSLVYNGSFWLLLTLPLTVICTTIFWCVTKFSEAPPHGPVACL